MKFKIDNLQYCNWTRKVFEINREAGLDAVHVTIVYHEDFDELKDQIKKWDLPVILVCKSSLGTLNHTLLSIEALQRRNINILGLVINGEKHLDNPKTLVKFSGIPIITEFPFIKEIDSNNLDILWKELDIKNKLVSLLNSTIS